MIPFMVTTQPQVLALMIPNFTIWVWWDLLLTGAYSKNRRFCSIILNCSFQQISFICNTRMVCVCSSTTIWYCYMVIIPS